MKKKVFPHQIAFNCIPHIDSFVSNVFTKEEMKIINESRKILGLPSLKITATAVRVPTLISHSESVNIETEKELSPEAARDCLEEAGVVVVDEPEKNRARDLREHVVSVAQRLGISADVLLPRRAIDWWARCNSLPDDLRGWREQVLGI